MSEFTLFLEMYKRFAASVRSDFWEEYAGVDGCAERVAVRYWLGGLKMRTGCQTAYALERFFEKDSFHLNHDGSIQYYRNKWSKYENGATRPRAITLARVEALAPGSTRELEHPLWRLIGQWDKKEEIKYDSLLRSLSAEIQSVIFRPSGSFTFGLGERKPVTVLLADQLVRRANLDSLAAVIVLMLEAYSADDSALLRVLFHALHRMMLMMATEFQAREVAFFVIGWLLRNILPLGLPQHRFVSMSARDYIQASAVLNLLVFQVKDPPKKLTWEWRAKLMERLLQGKMGFDVYHAMLPQLGWKTDIKGISLEELEDLKNESSRIFKGWVSVLGGMPELLGPPPSFLSQNPVII